MALNVLLGSNQLTAVWTIVICHRSIDPPIHPHTHPPILKNPQCNQGTVSPWYITASQILCTHGNWVLAMVRYCLRYIRGVFIGVLKGHFEFIIFTLCTHSQYKKKKCNTYWMWNFSNGMCTQLVQDTYLTWIFSSGINHPCKHYFYMLVLCKMMTNLSINFELLHCWCSIFCVIVIICGISHNCSLVDSSVNIVT